MGVREMMNRNQLPTIVIVGTLTVSAIALAVHLGRSNRVGPGMRTFFSVDDGQTWFKDDLNKLAPFDYDGKPAVRARLFTCGGGKPFVGYLERYTADAKKKIEASRARKTPGVVDETESLLTEGIEVKKPGTGAWVKKADAKAFFEVTRVKCPNGDGDAEPYNME